MNDTGFVSHLARTGTLMPVRPLEASKTTPTSYLLNQVNVLPACSDTITTTHPASLSN
jgi:hypothetical protein